MRRNIFKVICGPVIFLLLVVYSAAGQSTGPTLLSLSPNSVAVGARAVTITLSGTGFTSSSVIRVNGESLPTTFVDSSTLRSLVPDIRFATSAALPVTVFNSDTSRSSAALVLSVYSSSPPTVTSIAPSGAFRGTSVTLTVSGTNLIGAVIVFSGTGLRANLPTADTTVLRAQITIDSDAPLGAQTLTISTPSGSTSTCGSGTCQFAVVESGTWTPTGPLHDLRSAAAKVKLLDGRVLIAGGGTNTAEILDPATGEWTPGASMSLSRSSPASTLLPDGRVLIAGGSGDGSSPLSSVEIYDPLADTWTTAGFLANRGTTGVLLLTNGKVLVTEITSTSVTGEIFDPATGRFQSAQDLQFSVSIPVLSRTLLSDGRALLVEGYQNRIYDPIAMKMSEAASLGNEFTNGAWPRLLPDGRVLIRGAHFFPGTSGGQLTDIAALYTAQTNTMASSAARVEGTDVLLPSGLVLISGGYNPKNAYEPGILYDPLSDQVLPLAATNVEVNSVSSLLLDDGRALLISVPRGGTLPANAYAEIYTPTAYSNPSPFIRAVTASNPASESDFISLDIRGSAFLPNSSLQVGSTKLVTLYLGSQRLVAFVPPALRAALASSGIRAVNPAPGGGATGSVPVGFVAPPPAITALSPNAATPGSQFNAIISGQNFDNPVSVNFASAGVTAAIQAGGSSTTLLVSVSVAGDAAIGARSLTVTTASGSVTLANALRIQRSTLPATAPLPISDVETGAIRSGYVVITPDSGSALPTATLTYGMVRNAIIQSQAAILPGPLMTDTSLLVDVVQPIGRNLGLAIANTAGTAASISMTLRDEDGTAAGPSLSISIPGHQQVARFLTELFPSSTIGAAFRGSLSIQSSTPVSIIGLRFSGVEFSTLPSSAAGPTNPSTTIVFPQFAVSGGWATTLGLVNTMPGDISGRIDVFDPLGNPMTITLNAATRSTFTYVIPTRGSLTLAPRDANGQSPF